THLDFLSQLTESIGIVLNTIQASTRTESLLVQSQSLTDELRRANEELKDKAHLLVKQKEEVEQKNKEVEEARLSLEEKAEQLQLTSKYKSEFLANMSHELRTPLNSLLILAQQLYENHDGNLSAKQVNYAKTIHSCGDDLIQLINDILDLSKIESGYISTDFVNLAFREITGFVETTFKHVSENKNLQFIIEVDDQLPASLETDPQRLNQILKNLLSNAFKFTEKGEVNLRIYKATYNRKLGNSTLQNAEAIVAFEIRDTGIGISKDKQGIIFEAFQQAEGSTSRKYGGTGLGLSISRGLSDLLGGTLELESEPGKGSTFTLYLPLTGSSIPNYRGNNLPFTLSENENAVTEPGYPAKPAEARDLKAINELVNEPGDDRNNITADDKVVLAIEDDIRFGKIMMEKVHEMDMKIVIATHTGDVFELINKFNPVAITLDVKLPDDSGWRILDLFKNDVNFRHIPVHIISGEENRMLALQRGARSFHQKPLKAESLQLLLNDILHMSESKHKKVLLIEDNDLDSTRIAGILNNGKLVELEIASSGAKALDMLKENAYDGIITDYMLPDIAGSELISTIHSITRTQITPLLVYSAKDFTAKEKTQLKKQSNKIVTKDFSTPEVLLEEAVNLLHINYNDLTPEKRKMLRNLQAKNDILVNKKILIVDDDVRNLFALTTAFERYQINTLTAESGQEAMSTLAENNDIDIVLMDIMMPEMDGYETMQKIRREHKNRKLPIIAVTAKAMKGDREKCIEAGASDYITKPVKIDQLLSLMRVWLYK
ncbi:MAG: response regulator, partial [Agriterribacter sp.]